jgi:hypothetical protein
MKIPCDKSVVQPIRVPEEQPVPEPSAPAGWVIFTYGSAAAKEQPSQRAAAPAIDLAKTMRPILANSPAECKRPQIDAMSSVLPVNAIYPG